MASEQLEQSGTLSRDYRDEQKWSVLSDEMYLLANTQSADMWAVQPSINTKQFWVVHLHDG